MSTRLEAFRRRDLAAGSPGVIYSAPMHVPRLLAPAGDVSAFKAAVSAGADEIYFGLPKFNARMNATNITADTLPELLTLAHRRGVRVFLTTNVLFVESELPELVDLAGSAIDAGVDGFIVQDYGVLRVLVRTFPGVELHASTQMTTHNSGQVEFLAKFGVRRINLARELSLQQIELISAFAHTLGVETEVFVHGAYCLSFSGQCYMSSFMGGLSGNRGLCFQPCRRAYRSPGHDERTPISADFPLSLKDNSAFAGAGALAAAAVDSLKIEGRMKGVHYVYSTVSAWRRQLDRLATGESPAEWDERLDRVFNRGFSSGYLDGRVSAAMHAETPFDRSLLPVGRVDRFYADRMAMTISPPDSGERARPAPGVELAVYSPLNRLRCRARVVASGSEIVIEILGKLEDRIRSGDHLFLNAGVDEAARIAAMVEEITIDPIRIDVTVSGEAGAPLVACFVTAGAAKSAVAGAVAGAVASDGGAGADAGVCEVTVESGILLAAATKSALGAEAIERQLGRLGGTAFTLGHVDVSKLAKGLFLPVSELNSMRRQAVELLTTMPRDTNRTVSAVESIPVRAPVVLGHERSGGASSSSVGGSFAVIVSIPEDAELVIPLLDSGDHVILEVGDPRKFPAESSFVPYLPVITMDELLPAYREFLMTRDAALLDNAGPLVAGVDGAGLRWIAAQGFNLTNHEALLAVSRSGGAAGGVLSSELSREQLREAIEARETKGEPEIWVPIFGPIALMTTMQCLARGRCTKTAQDESCVPGCTSGATLEDTAGHRFHIVKRPWFHTVIYNELPLSLPQAIVEFRRSVDAYVVDLRRLPPLGGQRIDRPALLRVFRDLRASCLPKSGSGKARGTTSDTRVSEAALEIRRLVGETTSGNYRRGLSRERGRDMAPGGPREEKARPAPSTRGVLEP
jgi:U32 family peptidase